MLKCDIVIIDTGVYKSFTTERVAGVTLEKKDGKIVLIEDYEDNIGHGTAVFSIIKKRYPDIFYYIIKISNDINLPIDDEVLLAALEHVYKNVDCKIINLSAGTESYKNEKNILILLIG